MRLLGAVLAGGRSRRFGSDKALAMVDGQSLMAHAVFSLSFQVEEVVACGRAWPGLAKLPDRPCAGFGPLGGLNAAMHHACTHGFDAVLSASVDTYPVPRDLADRLRGDRPRHLARHYLVGFWPSSLAQMLDVHLAAGHRSVRSWIEACAAAPIEDAAMGIHNIKTPANLALARVEVVTGDGDCFDGHSPSGASA